MYVARTIMVATAVLVTFWLAVHDLPALGRDLIVAVAADLLRQVLRGMTEEKDQRKKPAP